MSAHDVYGTLTALGLVPMFLAIMAVSRRYVTRVTR